MIPSCWLTCADRPPPGGLDPLLDDTVDFNTRIRRMGVGGDMFIYRSLPHTFMSFPHWHAMPEVQQAMAHSVDFLSSVLRPAEGGPAQAAGAAQHSG